MSSHRSGGHYIEYKGFLSNHLSHLVTALERLGAGEDQVAEAGRAYCHKLEGREGDTAKQQQAEAEGEVEELLGKRRSFYHLEAHYTLLLEKAGSPEALVRCHLAKLGQGLGCAALHPLLNIGYGLAGGDSTAVVEGLAYLHHSFVGLQLEEPGRLEQLGGGSLGLEEVLGRLREDLVLREQVERGTEEEWVTSTGLGGFQKGMVVILTRHGDQLLEYALALARPQGLSLASWIQDLALRLYTKAEVVNDFFLLHLVTATWALTSQVPGLWVM